jgi:pimeloyl-ACP methyl ester carboxylesterase
MSGFYQSGSARLAFSDTGRGIPVVFLHPTPLDRDYWRPLIAELTGIRAIVPDLRGHGASQLGSGLPVGEFSLVPDAPVLTMAQFAADTLALLDHLNLPTAIFAGCSIGGYVLLELWRQAPQRMDALAFICSKPQPDTEAGLAKRAETIAHIRAEGAGKFLDTTAQTLPGATARRTRPSIVAEVRSRMTLTAAAVIAVQAGLAARPDSVPTVATITVPVLSIAGGEDTAVKPDEMEAFKNAFGGCESHLLADAGHFAAYEQPHAVATLLAPWLRGLASS